MLSIAKHSKYLSSIWVIAGAAVLTCTARAAPIATLLAAVQSEKPSITSADGDTKPAIPEALQTFAETDAKAGERDRVLNQMRAGVVALELGEPDYAVSLFMDAHAQIDTIYANDPIAKKARSVFVPDATKEFKGDAYERAMLGYYLGLAYLMKGDAENARASFKWGEFQDTMSAGESYQSDMAALTFLKGWVAQCQGEPATASEEFALAQHTRASLVVPKQQDNLLALVELGSGPIKIGSGKYKENLSFQRGEPSPATGATWLFGSQSISPVLAEDVYWQASTLGGRAVDKILAGKASFKQGAETTANVAGGIAQAGLVATNQALLSGDNNLANSMAGVSAVSGLFSFGAKLIANRAKPAADVRYWNNLPDQLWLGTAQYADQPTGTLDLKDVTGARLAQIPVVVHKTGACYLAWTRDSLSRAVNSTLVSTHP